MKLDYCRIYANSVVGEVDSFLTILSVSVLRSAWVESDPVVRTSMWQPLLKFITGTPLPLFFFSCTHCFSRVPEMLGT